jgi:hypothetical protein
MNNNQSEVRELIAAAAAMREAVNKLWHAYNPEDGPYGEVALSVEEAEELQADAFMQLQRAEYYAEKALLNQKVDR